MFYQKNRGNRAAVWSGWWGLLATLITYLGLSSGAVADMTALEAPIIITASRLPEPLDQALGNPTVIESQTIEQSMATDVAELLEQLGTVDVIHNGGPGQGVSVFLRGANSNQTLVLLDGVRLNPGTFGLASLQNIAPNLVDHIEVITGPRSSLYGSDAMGGVINIITKDPQGSGGDLNAQWGTFNTRTVDVDGFQGSEHSHVFGALHWEESHGYPTQVGDTNDRGFRNGSYLLKADTVIAGAQIAAESWRTSGDVAYSDPTSTPIGRSQYFNNERSSLSLQGSLLPTTHSSLRISQLIDNLEQTTSPDFDTTHRTQIDATTDIWLGAHKLLGGALLNFDHISSSVYGTKYDVSDMLHTFFVEDRYHTERSEAQASVALTHSTVFGNHETWNGGIGWHLTPTELLSLTGGTAFRAPTGSDLYGFGGNVALKPETSTNLELSFTKQISDHDQWSLTAYDHRIGDLITYTYMPTPDNPYNGTNENVNKAHIKGIEGQYSLTWLEWHFKIRGERQEALNESAGNSLLRRAHGMGALTLNRAFGAWNFNGEWLVVGKRDDIDSVTYGHTTNGSYALLNLGGQWQVNPALVAQVRIENAFDKSYQTANGYYAPGRVFKAGFRYAWH